MVLHWFLRYSMALSLSCLLQKATSIQLQPISPTIGQDNGYVEKRAPPSALELQNTETFLWGSGTGPSKPILAKFTVYTPGDLENIVSMERFSGMLKSVACTDTSMTLVFKDKQDLEYAQSSWDWVNRADNNAFILVAGARDCHWNEYRQPFNVTNVSYHNATDTASLTAKPFDWETIAHSYDLSVSSVPASRNQIQSRDYERDGSFDFTHSFPFSQSVTGNGLTTTLACADCSSTGKINWAFKASIRGFASTDVSLRLTPSGLGATATLKLTESGQLTSPLSTSVPILSIPIDGIEIAKIIDIGPSLDFSIGVDVGAVTGSGSVTGGASLSIPDSSVAMIDLRHSSNNDFNGWVPDVKPIPVSLDAKVEATLNVYIQSALNLDVKFLTFGYGAGLDLKMPNFGATLAADASTTGACGTNQASGVQVNATIGAELSVAVTEGKGKDLFDSVLANPQFPLAGTCIPFGPTVGASSTRTSTSTSTTAAASSTTPTSTIVATTAPSTNGTAVSTLLTVSTTFMSSSSQAAPTSTLISVTGTAPPQPSFTTTDQGSQPTNGTVQLSPRTLRRGEIEDVKPMAGLSRHLRSHELRRR